MSSQKPQNTGYGSFFCFLFFVVVVVEKYDSTCARVSGVAKPKRVLP